MSRSRNATRLSRALLALAVGAALAVPAAAYAQAQKTFELKFNHVLGPREPYHKGFQNWAKAVEERTKGGLKMQVFHSRPARRRGRHHRADPPGRQCRPEHRRRPARQLRAGDRHHQRPVLRRERSHEVAKLRNSPTIKK